MQIHAGCTHNLDLPAEEITVIEGPQTVVETCVPDGFSRSVTSTDNEQSMDCIRVSIKDKLQYINSFRSFQICLSA